MTALVKLNSRLKGLRLYLLSLILVIPELLDALASAIDATSGVDWSSIAGVLPEPFQTYATKAGLGLAVVRLTLTPAVLFAKGVRVLINRLWGSTPSEPQQE